MKTTENEFQHVLSLGSENWGTQVRITKKLSQLQIETGICGDYSENEMFVDVGVNELIGIRDLINKAIGELGTSKLIQKFEQVLDYVSGSNVSNHDTDLQVIIKQIDEHQSKHHYSIVKQDIQAIIDGEPDFGEAVLSIQSYINNL